MEKIQFLNSTNIYDVQLSKGGNTVKLVFANKSMPNDLTAGFNLINEHNGNVMGDYSEYTTVYKFYAKKDYTVELSNDGSVYVEMTEHTVRFNAGQGGSLEGETEQVVENYNELVLPSPIEDENYHFVKWDPEVPSKGKVDTDKSFTAVFEYEEPIEITISNRITEMNNIQQEIIAAGTDVELSTGIEHFTATDADQRSLAALQAQVMSGADKIPWHSVDAACKYYSNEDMAKIITKITEFVTFHVTYYISLKIWLKSITDKEELASVNYGDVIPEDYRSEVLVDIYKAMGIK